MKNPALPATMREPVTDIDPLHCKGCETVIFSTARCILVKGVLWCSEACADRAVLRRLRRSGRALPY